MIFDGQETVGFSVSLTVTVKLQPCVLPDASVAVQLTVVVPFEKAVPEAGLHKVVTPGQLSVAVGEKLTTASHLLGSVDWVMLDGQVIAGFSVSLTVTVNVQLCVLSDVSVAVQVTVFVPFGKVEPDAGEQAAVAPGQLSPGVGVV